MTRGSFDAQRGRDGALPIASPDEVVDKILRHAEALGGGFFPNLVSKIAKKGPKWRFAS